MTKITCDELGVSYKEMLHEKLEPYEGKLSCTVLRGGMGSNAHLLPDQTVENKQKFISQVMTSKSPVRSCDDVDEAALSYAEIKALCAGDERIREKMDLDVEVARLRLLKSEHQANIYRLEDRLVRYFPAEIARTEQTIQNFRSDMETLAQHPLPEKGFVGMEVMGKVYTDKAEAGKALIACGALAAVDHGTEIGHYRGLSMSVAVNAFTKQIELTLKGSGSHVVELGTDIHGNLTRIENGLNSIPGRMRLLSDKLTTLRTQQAETETAKDKPFPQEAELRQKNARLAELDAELNIDTPPAAEPEKESPQGRPSIREQLNAPSRPGSSEKHRDSQEECI